MWIVFLSMLVCGVVVVDFLLCLVVVVVMMVTIVQFYDFWWVPTCG